MDRFLNATFRNQKSETLFILFLSLTFILNLLQAYFTGLHPDEAYYWVYSKFLDWGYFDHPPMVALFIKGGDYIFKSTLGLRLFTVLSNTLAVFILWQIVKKYTQNISLFILMISAVLLFHVYSFITTPDVPLFFFSVLFLYVYQIYLKNDKFLWAIILGIICAALLLSKYHGILLIFFVLLSHLKLFTRKSFYITLLITVLLCLPHLYWQYLNGYPSFYYHLIDRSAIPYNFNYTSQYFLDQLLMMGPLVGWLFFYYGYKQNSQEDYFLKALKFVFYGVLVFFFLSTFKGRVQAQWPLIEFVALFILAYIYAGKNLIHFSKFKWLFGINILLIIVARLLIMGFIPLANKIKFIASFQNYDIWANQLKVEIKGKPIIFKDGFQEASYYNYYTHSLNAVAYNSINYRQTQYDLWPLETKIQNKDVYLVEEGTATLPNEKNIETVKGVYHLTLIDSLRYYPKITFDLIDFPKKWKANEVKQVSCNIKNPYDEEIDFSNGARKWDCNFQYGFMKDGEVMSTTVLPTSLSKFKIASKQEKRLTLQIKAPGFAGDYKLFLSIKTQPFAGTRNSKMISLKVD